MSASQRIHIDSYVSAGFEAVRDAFAENFSRRGELAAPVACITGEKVVDLWGGVRNQATGEPWEEDTMVIVYSTTRAGRDDARCGAFPRLARLRRARLRLLAGIRQNARSASPCANSCAPGGPVHLR